MALVVYNNTYAVTAQNKLSIATSSLQKSIERLSSGLRINHASDDASGLAISEKLRGQIRGLAKANMNAQDAVSFLQTAEGGMEVIGDMLQRMRELAVQAGNGTYTSNDRKELQKEVDQLYAEINSISASTEYNTKKLLTGDAAALWSADSANIQAIVRGAPAEGNYKLAFEADGGQAAVYKSDIMSMAKDSITSAASLAVPVNGITGLTFSGNASDFLATDTIDTDTGAGSLVSVAAATTTTNGGTGGATVAAAAGADFTGG
jgi:flagellin